MNNKKALFLLVKCVQNTSCSRAFRQWADSFLMGMPTEDMIAVKAKVRKTSIEPWTFEEAVIAVLDAAETYSKRGNFFPLMVKAAEELCKHITMLADSPTTYHIALEAAILASEVLPKCSTEYLYWAECRGDIKKEMLEELLNKPPTGNYLLVHAEKNSRNPDTLILSREYLDKWLDYFQNLFLGK